MKANIMKIDDDKLQGKIDPIERSTSGQSNSQSSQEVWVPIQMNQTNLAIEDTIAATKTFFAQNSDLLKVVGLAIVAIIAIKLLFAGLNALDSIPLVTPILKLIGLVYTVRFVWRYLIREQDRRELVEAFNRIKSQVLGTQN